jgi:hypothetical protein
MLSLQEPQELEPQALELASVVPSAMEAVTHPQRMSRNENRKYAYSKISIHGDSTILEAYPRSFLHSLHLSCRELFCRLGGLNRLLSEAHALGLTRSCAHVAIAYLWRLYLRSFYLWRFGFGFLHLRCFYLWWSRGLRRTVHLH